MRYLIMFFSCSFYGQVLHHQMLSGQGASIIVRNGFTINQTVGQQGLTGLSSTDFVVIQGFQQSLWGKYIASTAADILKGIKITSFPNPFTETVNFQFSESVIDVVTVSVFDIAGRLVYQQGIIPLNNTLTINLSILPSTKYLVRLQTSKINYYTQIIRK